jgi:hypothetical protein
MVAQLQPVAQSGILIQTQPKLDDEKGRKSMNRRKGQNGRRHPVRLVSGPLAGGYRRSRRTDPYV